MVGFQLARYLLLEKNDVALIESNPEEARHASNRLDCLVLQDEGNNIHALEEAGIARADALVCVTGSDEINIIICGLAAARYPQVKKIARIRNEDYVKFGRSNERILGVDFFVHPDVEASRSILGAIEHGAAGEVISFADTSYELASVDIIKGSAFDSLALKDYRSLATGESLVTLLERKGECILPGGSTVLLPGDRIYILADEAEMNKVFALAGREDAPLRKIGIVGGSRIGTLVAEGIFSGDRESEEKAEDAGAGEKKGFFARLRESKLFKTTWPLFRSPLRKIRQVVIIEQDYAVCKELSGRFPEALILNEDISDENFVAEERISDLDMIVAATKSQELNVITALYLKSKGVRRAAAMVGSSGYGSIARQLGVDVVLPIKQIVTDSILSHIMGREVKRIQRIGDGNIGIIELDINGDAPVVGKSIIAFHVAAGSLVMLASRDGKSFIPRGDYVFKAGDRIILIAKNGSEQEIDRFFSASK
jgi:trk system potassium uptake protein TrkA